MKKLHEIRGNIFFVKYMNIEIASGKIYYVQNNSFVIASIK